MYRATSDIVMPTSLIGSLPRPSWFTENIGSRTFLQAMVDGRFREQYIDAVTAYLNDQETAGVDIVTDGDAHYDNEVGGQSWTSYPPFHMDGFDKGIPEPALYKIGGVGFPMGHILHDYLEAPGDARHNRPPRPRRPAIHRHVEGRPADDPQAGQVRHHRARDPGRPRSPTSTTPTRSSA